MQSDTTKFCVSTILGRLAEIGMNRMIGSWNAHHLPLRGIHGTTVVHPLEVPTVADAAAEYRQQGGRLTEPGPFGRDPLQGKDQLMEEREVFEQRLGLCFTDVYHNLMAGNKEPLERAILLFVFITEELED